MATKTPRKEFTLDVILYATPKAKRPRVSVGFGPEGLHGRDEAAYNKVHDALREFASYLASVGEL